MESVPNSKSSLPADETPELDLYTIPFSSSWFSWDSIHETERSALREFFDGSSYSRSPKIYKEYRDFIISKHREEPSRKLTFTEVRKSLVGDVSLVRKVFLCLESWGLINFNVCSLEQEEDEMRVRVEDGVPIGVKVVVAPNSLKPMPVPPPPARVGSGDLRGLGDGNGFNLPPLASYCDVFGELKRAEGLVCGNCKEKCDSKYYESAKDSCVICTKCFEKGMYGEGKTGEDFSLSECTDKNSDHGANWSEAETLLLLESVLKHGDDWDLVAQGVHSKTKSECISRLIEMSFGELMLGSQGKVSSKGTVNDSSTGEEMRRTKDDPDETDRMEDSCHEQIIQKEKGEQNGAAEDQSPLPKKRRIDSSHPDRPMIKQVALISDMVGPKVQAAAVGGAVSTLCHGNPFLEQIFYSEDVVSADGLLSGDSNMELDRPTSSMDLEANNNVGPSGGDENEPEKDAIPLPLRMRAAVATALGTAAARARLMANQEEREMELLIATVIETQLKKLQSKVKHFDGLEEIMGKEHDELQELKECVVAERMSVLKKIVKAGISR